MNSARKNGTKKRRGRPATGQGVQIGTRWPEGTVAAIDAWAAAQDNEPRRSERHAPTGRTRAECGDKGLIFSAIVSFVFNLAPKLRRVIDCLPEQSESCRHDDYQHVAQLSTVKKTGDENRCRDWYCAGDQNLFFARVLVGASSWHCSIRRIVFV